jgi:hypothetical protein
MVIGVGKAGSLPELPGARNGAKEFAAWASKQGYTTTLIDDSNGAIDMATVRGAVTKLLEPGIDRLLIYFAGHGAQPTADTPYLLLSNWEQDETEAINVNISTHNARRLGVGHVAFIVDACRSVVPGGSTLLGRSMFAKVEPGGGLPGQCDRFFSCQLDAISQEVVATATVPAYGVFSRCLMKALVDLDELAVEDRGYKQVPPRAITSESLSTYLDKMVPLESGKLPGGIVQIPDTVPTWKRPDDVYMPIAPEPPQKPEGDRAGAGWTTGAALPMETIAGKFTRIDEIIANFGSKDKVVAERERLKSRIERTNQAALSYPVRGVTIVGDCPAKVIDVRHPFQVFSAFIDETVAATEAYRIPFYEPDNGAFLIELSSGNWISVPHISQFSEACLIEDAVSVSQAYILNFTFQKSILAEYQAAGLIAEWTTAMHQGRVVKPIDLKNAHLDLKDIPYLNPTLGILAAYGFDRIGDVESVNQIASRLCLNNRPVPFDVALLSSLDIIRSENGALKIRVPAAWYDRQGFEVDILGTFPFMTRGWSLLDARPELQMPEMLDLRRNLRAALWTTLDSDGGNRLVEFYRRKWRDR